MQKIEYDLGNLGEAIAGGLLSIIFNGETSKETLRGEGQGALDLQLKYPTISGIKTSRQIAVQVKTGQSFARWNKTNSHYTLQNINSEHIKKWQKNNQPVLIIWVNPIKKVELYWKLVNSKTSEEVLHLSPNHKLKPESLFEINRLISIAYNKKGGVPKITLKSFEKLSDVRKWSKKEFKKITGIYENEIGKFEISNYAFRHLTRASRNKSHIKESLLLLRHIKTFLDVNPHQIQTISNEDWNDELEENNHININRRVLFIYRNIHFNDMKSAVVYIRFKESINYPKNWTENLLLNKQTKYSLKLESIYRKS
jgi:hypothetical protein